MPTFARRIRDVLSTKSAVARQHQLFELINTSASLLSNDASDEIDENTFSELLAGFDRCLDSRTRCCIGILILELLKYSDVAYTCFSGANDSSKHAFGAIIVAAENEDLKLVTGTIIHLACSKGASPTDFFSSGLSEVAETFPQGPSAQWVDSFQDYLLQLEAQRMIQESNSTMLFASSVFIDDVQYGDEKVSIMVELSSDLLTLTQVSTSSQPLMIDITLKYIKNAQFQSRKPLKSPMGEDTVSLPRMVLTLVPTRTNCVANGEEISADIIELLPEPSYDVKGFLAAIQLKQKGVPVGTSAQLLPHNQSQHHSSPVETGKPRESMKSSIKVVYAFTKLQDEPASAKKISSGETSSKQPPRSIRAQMRNEKGEQNASASTPKLSTSRKREKGKLVSPDKKVQNPLESKGQAESEPIEDQLDDTGEVFEIASSPDREEPNLKMLANRATSGNKKRYTRKSATGKKPARASKEPKGESKSTFGTLQMKTRSSTASERYSFTGSRDVETYHAEYEADFVPEENNPVVKPSCTGAESSSKTHTTSEFEKSEGQDKDLATSVHSTQFRTMANASPVLPIQHENSNHSSMLKHGKSYPNEHGGFLFEKSIRKPSIVSFGPNGPMNQGVSNSKTKQSPIYDEYRQTTPSKLSSGRKEDTKDSEKLVEEELAVNDIEVSSPSPPPTPIKKDKTSQGRHEKTISRADDHFICISDVESSPTERKAAEMAQVSKEQNQSKAKETDPQLVTFKAQDQRTKVCANVQNNIEDVSRSEQTKRPLESISPNIVHKRTKKSYSDHGIRRNETSILQYEDFRDLAGTEDHSTGSQLSRRVDTNGSPYPKNTRLPIDRIAAPIPKLAISQEKYHNPSYRKTTGMKISADVQRDTWSAPQHGVTFQDSSILWCENLPSHVTTHNVRDLFGFYGSIEWCWLVPSEHSQLSSCCGYIKMHTATEAASAVEFLNGRSLQGLTLLIRKVDGRLAFGPADETLLPSKYEHFATESASKSAPTNEKAQPNRVRKPTSPIAPVEWMEIDKRVVEEVRPVSAPYVVAKALPDSFEDAITRSPSVSAVGERGVRKVTRPSLTSLGTQKIAKDDTSAEAKSKMLNQISRQLVTFASPVAVIAEDALNQTADDYWGDSEQTIAEEEDESEEEEEDGDDSNDGDFSEVSTGRSMQNTRNAGTPAPELRGFYSSEDSSSPQYSEEASVEHEHFSEGDQIQWDNAMKPHQKSYADALIQISQRLLRHLMNKEEAIEEIASEYRASGLKFAEKLEDSRMHDAEVMETERKRQGDKLAGSLKTLAGAMKINSRRARELEAILKDMSEKMAIADKERQQLADLDQLLAT